MADYGMSEPDAVFYLAVSYGVLFGDVVDVGGPDDKTGDEVIAELEMMIGTDASAPGA